MFEEDKNRAPYPCSALKREPTIYGHNALSLKKRCEQESEDDREYHPAEGTAPSISLSFGALCNTFKPVFSELETAELVQGPQTRRQDTVHVVPRESYFYHLFSVMWTVKIGL